MKRIFETLLNLDSIYKRILQVAFDSFFIVLSYFTAMALRFDGFHFLAKDNVWLVLIFILPSTIYLQARLGLYRAVLRFISSHALKTIIVCVTFSSIVMFASAQILTLPIPRSVPIIYAILLFCFIASIRFGWRAYFRFQSSKGVNNAVIYGAGKAGRQLLNAMRYSGDYNIVAFIDDNSRLHGQEIGSVRVHSAGELSSLRESMNISAVILAIPSAGRSKRRQIIGRIEELNLEIHTIPDIGDLLTGKAKVADLKVVNANELLARDVVQAHETLMKANIESKNVMVTGAGGSIGSELCRQIIRQKPERLILFDVSEFGIYRLHDELLKSAKKNDVELIPIIGSVQNRQRLDYVLKTCDVHTLYHAAAYKHVPLVEQNIVEGVLNNVFGTKNVAESAIKNKVEALILISTDKAVRPTNFMGASKRVAELICQSHAKNKASTLISMVRFGNVLGSSGSVIPRFEEQIRIGGPVTVTHPKITRFFMTISEAAQLVIQASSMANGGDVFVLDMGEPVEIVDVAERMIRLHGLKPYYENSPPAEVENGDICIVFTGLRPGEKLYEELLIGENVKGTKHPRIMSADEVWVEQSELDKFLEDLKDACATSNVNRIHEIFLELPLEFAPSSQITDFCWNKNGEPGSVPKSDNV